MKLSRQGIYYKTNLTENRYNKAYILGLPVDFSAPKLALFLPQLNKQRVSKAKLSAVDFFL